MLIEHGGVVLLQSDVASTAEEMRKEFCLQGSSVFEPHPLHNEQGSNNISSLTANAWSMHHNHMSARQASARALLEAPQAQIKHSWLEAGWLADNPWNTATEREVYHANITGAPVYRLYLQRI